MVLLVALTFIATACTGGRRPSPRPVPPSSASLPSQQPRAGGEAVFGAERWPECINPITACASTPWTWYVVLEHVLPRAMQLDESGNYVASPLLLHAPSLANGEVAQDPFTVTFRLSAEATWEDGSPITTSDIAFTWRAIRSTRGAYIPAMAGYDLIEGIEGLGPKTAIIHFRDVYVNWPELFGGVNGFILKEAAFPELRGQGRPDLTNEMLDDIPFSGGPFELLHWSGREAQLVRNEHYFGTRALLDRVTFVPTLDQPTELEFLQNGEVDAIYPQPSEESLLDQCCATAVGGDGLWVEVLRFDVTVPPLDQLPVRQALMYAIDRQSVVDQIVKLNNPDAEILNCGLFATPRMGPWCRDGPFGRFTYDPARARSILEGAGYDCVPTPCTKGGKPLRVNYVIEETNTRRIKTQDLIVARAEEAGFELVPDNFAGDLPFGDLGSCFIGRSGAIGECGLPAFPDQRITPLYPSVTDLLSCDAIPTEANGFHGLNHTHWCNHVATRLMRQADREMDPAGRLDLMSQVYEMEALDAIGLPLYVLPAVSVWRDDEIAGPIGVWNGTPYGLFFNMNEWYLSS